MGAVAVFGPGTVIAEAASDLLVKLSATLHGSAEPGFAEPGGAVD
jgi:methylmalonyl-CoA mutase